MNPFTVPPLLPNHEIAQLLDEFTLSQAAELARDGTYDQAELHLRPIVERPDPPITALDLQARICAQRGRLNDAVLWWQKVLDREPDNFVAQSALAKINQLQRRSLWFSTLTPMLVWGGAVALVIFIIAWQAKRNAGETLRLRSEFTQSLNTQAKAAEMQIKLLESQLKEMSDSLDQSATSLWETRHQLTESKAALQEFAKKQNNATTAISHRLARIERRIVGYQPSQTRYRDVQNK